MSTATKKRRKKKCKICKKQFHPFNTLQVVCSVECAKENAKLIIKKENRKKKLEFLANDLSHQKQLAQNAFNKFIRLRDRSLPCISCGTFNGQRHAGHYKSIGAYPAIRFHPDNVHGQCAQCNNWKSANLTNYRINLIQKIGLEKVEWLESEHEPKRYTLAEIIEIKDYYKQKCKELES